MGAEKGDRIMKSKNLAVIEKKLTSKDITNRIAISLDLDPEDEIAQKEAFKYASSVISEIAKTEGQEYGDITKCTPESICRAIVDAAQFKIQIDGRKLAHIESRWDKSQKANVAVLQIDTNGFVAKIKEFYPDAEFIITPVFKDDTVEIYGDDGKKTFKHKSNNPFGGVNDLQGIVVQISYTMGNRRTSDVHTISVDDLKKVASMGKSTAWKDFTIERMKTAALKRACKWHFRQNSLIRSIVDYDNRQYRINENEASPVRSTIIDNINRSIENGPAGSSGDDEVIEAEAADGDAGRSRDDLVEAGSNASSKGVGVYKEFIKTLTDKEKEKIKDNHSDWSRAAKEADENKDDDLPI